MDKWLHNATEPYKGLEGRQVGVRQVLTGEDGVEVVAADAGRAEERA